MTDFPKTNRNKVRRIPKRGHYDKDTIYTILDAGFLCHVGFVVDGQPFVIPTAYGREGDRIYIHGATKSRMLQQAKAGIPVCLTVTHLDGLVLARSAFHHSMNYRSVVIFGTATEVEAEEKERALFLISEQILKGRWEEVRAPNATELKATSVLAIEIDEASAKIRTGDPGDEEEDYELPIWAGVLPIHLHYGTPIPDPLLKAGIPLAQSVCPYATDLKSSPKSASFLPSNSTTMSKPIGRPTSAEYAPYQHTYISKTTGDDPISLLETGHQTMLQLMRQLPAEKWDFRYAADKWTIKEAIIHMIDTERIIAYRALRISRNDKTPLPSFEQDDYVPFYGVAERSPESIIAEYDAVRKANLLFFNYLPADAWERIGTASNNPNSVRALAFTIAGHELHHIQLFRERYGIG